MEKLREDHSDILGSSATVQEGLDVIKANIQWLKHNEMEIGMWLDPTKTTTLPTTKLTTSTEPPSTESSTELSTDSSAGSSTTSAPSSTKPATTPATVPPTTPSGGDTIRSQLALTFLCVLMGRWILHL